MAYKNKADQRAASKRHYEANKPAMIARAKKHEMVRRTKVSRHILEYLLKNPCVDCGEGDPIVLEFDHRGDKLFNVSDANRNGKSLPIVIKEIEKCDIRCANCHRRVTYHRAGRTNRTV